MLALNRTTIDFFSLDVQGAEIPILKTVNFNKFNIRTMTVEIPHGDGAKDALTSLLAKNGMKPYKTIGKQDGIYVRDIFFIKDNISPLRGSGWLDTAVRWLSRS